MSMCVSVRETDRQTERERENLATLVHVRKVSLIAIIQKGFF